MCLGLMRTGRRYRARIVHSAGPVARLTLLGAGGYFSATSGLTTGTTATLSWPRPRVQLLIAVINEEEKLDEILSGLVELGVTGATIIGSEGMGRVLSHDVPIFAGLEALALRSRPQNQTIFSVIRDDGKVDQVIALLQEICGNLDDPATGIVFTIPVTRVVGLAPELGQEDVR